MRTQEHVDIINERIEELTNVIEILKEIRDNPNIGEKTICEKHGMDFHKYRRYTYDADWFVKSSNAAQSEESTAKRMQYLSPTLSWYENLWLNVMGLKFGDLAACPSDIEETLDILIEQQLKETERKVILYRYEDGLTFDEIGKLLCLTSSRIRQIEIKAIRKLRYAGGWMWLGKDRVISVKEIQKQIENDIAIATKHQVIQKLDDRLVTLRKIINDSIKETTAEYIRSHPDLPIEGLSFSVRTFNCLIRAGIRTISDLKNCSADDLSKIRNFGRKSLNEIEQTLTSFGYQLLQDA